MEHIPAREVGGLPPALASLLDSSPYPRRRLWRRHFFTQLRVFTGFFLTGDFINYEARPAIVGCQARKPPRGQQARIRRCMQTTANPVVWEPSSSASSRSRWRGWPARSASSSRSANSAPRSATSSFSIRSPPMSRDMSASLPAMSANGQPGVACVMDVQTIHANGGSVIIEAREPRAAFGYRVHWAGARSSDDGTNCGSTADLLHERGRYRGPGDGGRRLWRAGRQAVRILPADCHGGVMIARRAQGH